MLERFQELTNLLDHVYEQYGVPSCDCIVMQNRKLLYRHRSGELHDSDAEKNETYWIYSATKIATATAAMQLIEKGKLSLLDPVSKYLPEFETLTVREKDDTIRAARSKMTIAHLMTMTGGLDYDLTRPSLVKARTWPANQKTTRNIVSTFVQDPLSFDPGTHFQYSLCHDVLGAVIEVVSGQRLCDYMQEHLFAPLGMADTSFHPSNDLKQRLVTPWIYDENGKMIQDLRTNRYCFSELYDSGGAGLMSTAEDYSQFLSMLSMGGTTKDNAVILQKETIQQMASPALNAIALKDFHQRNPAQSDYSYGLGVRVLIESGENTPPLGEFGWDGAAGAYALVDMKNHVSVYYAQQVRSTPNVYSHLHPRLRKAVYQGLSRT